jgi:two-component system, chemotaxis family, protein-glutamate methylesterase/glutaminase
MPRETDSGRNIRVLVADDSAFMRTAITRMIQSDSRLRVVATAQNGKEALAKIDEFDPDVVTLDIEMPQLDGLGVLRRLMAENPRPVIMVSSLTQEGAEATLAAFDLGAFDVLAKSSSYASLDILHLQNELIAKIKAGAAAARTFQPRIAVAPPPPARLVHPLSGPPPVVIAIGTSTGGPKALQGILPKLPANFPAGIVIVQHMPKGFTGPFAKRLDALSEIEVREAEDNDPVRPGVALIAPAGWHMTLFHRSATQYAVRLAKTPATLHIPSVDVLMLSAAEVCGSRVMGVILTGMGNDGAQGMKAISEKKGHTLGQDEDSCTVYGMPRACAELGILARVAPLSHIADEIIAAAAPPTPAPAAAVNSGANPHVPHLAKQST